MNASESNQSEPPLIIGHTTQCETLAHAAARGTLPGTLFFAGPSGIGKRLVARALAKQLLCHSAEKPFGGCGVCQSCTLIKHNSMPDLIELECGGEREGLTERVRELLRTLSLRSFIGKSRVILFNDADELNVQSANVLLKTLEEPRPNTWIILVAAYPEKLPSTVLSRCQRWNFNPLSNQELEQVVMNNEELRSTFSHELIAIADGSIEQYIRLFEQSKLIATYEEKLTHIARGAVNETVQLCQSIAKDKESAPSTVALLQRLVRKRMHSETTDVRWAYTLSNLIAAERLITERHLGIAHLLISAFSPLIGGPCVTELAKL